MSKRIKFFIITMIFVVSSLATAGTALARGTQCWYGPGYFACDTGGGDTCIWFDDGTVWCSGD